MYKIIGADGKQYVSASEEQLRQWIGEGRVNARTTAQGPGDTAWKYLADFAEFHAALGISPGTAPPISPPVQAHFVTGLPGAEKKIPAGILGILLGCLGVHKFILGYTGEGITMLLITVLTCGIAAPITGLIGFIEGIIYLTRTDEEFVRTYILNKKGWF